MKRTLALSARVARGVVIASTLVAVAIGLWPTWGNPIWFFSLSTVLIGAAALARWRHRATTVVVLTTAYVSYGIVRLVAGPETAALPYFVAAFTGLTLGISPWSRWESPRPWQAPLIWWALSVAIGWPVSAAREMQDALPIGGIVTTALLQMALVLWMDHLLGAPREGPARVVGYLHRPGWRLPFIASATITAAAATYQSLVDVTWLSREPWIDLRRAVGLMGDANPTAIATGIWAPIALWRLAGSGVSALAGMPVAVLLWLGAWFSGARSSLILLPAAALALSLSVVSQIRWNRRRIIVTGALALVILAGVIVYPDMLVAQNTPVGRLRVFLAAVPREDWLHEVLVHRDGYGLAANEAIKDHPVVGLGVGRFFRMAPDYYERSTGAQHSTGYRLPPDNAQNLWRHTWAEQGLVGLVPVVWLTGLTALAVARRLKDRTNNVEAVMLVALGLTLVVGYPVQDAGIAVTLATLVCAVAVPAVGRGPQPGPAEAATRQASG